MKRFIQYAAIISLLTSAARAQNENVNWQAPVAIAGASDVSTNGVYYGSWAPYDGVANTYPVSGVAFQANSDLPNFSATFPQNDQNGYNGYASPGTSNVNYNTLLETATYAGSGSGTIVITWSDVPGRTYLIQAWANDGRGNGRSETITGGTNTSASLLFGNFPGQYIIGTYVADASGSETITLDGASSTNGDDPQINLLLIRDITPNANVTWQPPVTISGTSDVNTLGAYFGSWAPSDANANTLPVNGVTFQGTSDLPNLESGPTLENGFYNSYNGFGSPHTSDTNYNALLQYAAYSNEGSDPAFFSWSGMTPGDLYLVQFWVNDGRSIGQRRTETITGGTNTSAPLNFGSDGSGPGQYIVGTFVANTNGEETLALTAFSNGSGPDTQINLVQVRDLNTNFPPYLSAVVAAPTNVVYVNNETPIVLNEVAVNPLASKPGYQWQWDQGLGGAFSNLTGGGATTPSFSVPTNLAAGTYKFQVVVTNLYGTNTTKPVAISVLPVGPPILSSESPSSFTVYSMSGPVTFAFSAIGLAPLSYQWVSDNGTGDGVFTSVNGATTDSLVVNPSSLASNATYTYELVVSNSLAAVTSAPVTLTIAAIPEPRSQGFFWGPVATVMGDADIATNGSGVVAFDAAPTALTLNGVAFNSFAPSDAYPLQPGGFFQSAQTDISTNTGAVTTTLTIGSGGTLFWYDGFSASSLAPFSTLPGNYQSFLGAGDGDFGTDPWTLEFNGLTPGTAYELELWVNDSRINGAGRVDTISDGTLLETPLLSFNNQGAAGGVGSYIIGTALADTSGNMVVTIQGNSSTQVNAFQLRELPAVVGKPVVNPPQPPTAVEYMGQNGTVTFTSAAGGTGPLSYQWIQEVSPGHFSDISGATTNSLALNTTGLAAATYQYFLVVSNSFGVTTSSVASLIVSAPPTPPAQGINWGPTAQVTGDSDVQTNGVGVVAFDAAGTAVTLNGVAFSSFAPSDAYPLPTQPGQFFQSAQTGISNTTGAVTTTLTIGSSGTLFWYDGFGSSDLPFTSFSTNYQGLLSAGDGDFGNDAWTLEFSGLTPKAPYELQFWANDSRTSGILRSDTLSSGGSSSAPVLFNTLELAGGVGSFVVGTGLAGNDGTITVDVRGNASTQVNAFQLRALPTGPTISIAPIGTNVVISWTGSGGVLEQAPTVLGPWTTNSATSPYTAPAIGTAEFYRIKLP